MKMTTESAGKVIPEEQFASIRELVPAHCDSNKTDIRYVLSQDECVSAQINGPVTIHNQVKMGLTLESRWM